MQTFYKRLLQKRETLSLLEKQVLEYILSHPEKIIQMNLSQVSKETFVSTATISRTCKQLGYAGFQELKYTLSQYVKTEKQQLPLSFSSITGIEEMAERIRVEVDQTLSHLNKENLSKGADYLIKSNRVEFFGVGASLPSCLDAARKLTFSGRIANAREDWDELRAVAHSLTPDDVAILVSYSGETIHIIEFATILKQRNVPIIGIIGTDNSQLEQLASLTYQAKITNCYYGDVDMSSRIPLNLVLEFLIIHYLNISTLLKD
ncbi:MurR/RpiR family transcriptional regulator [Carnobacterium maltaromaticum]|uniref:MurR/RpiR family transcriptional regulator n=1 Tax=Carnobacterium maltaromaticum TaxID=2751 RepID=UPI0009C5FF7D|nr:Helix-turn-helix domain, rpiR family protein [Carnobacterium maltaromaticum]